MLAAIIISLPGMILHMLPVSFSSLSPKILNIRFRGFYSSVYYIAGIILFPLFYILQAVFLASILSLPCWFLLLLIPAQYIVGKLSFRIFKDIQFLFAKIRLFQVAKKHPNELRNLQILKTQITETLLNRAF
jgi:hypothetical protein